MGFLKGIKDELSHAVNEYVNSEEDEEDRSYSASREAEEALRRRRNEKAEEEEQEERYYDEMFDNLPTKQKKTEEDGGQKATSSGNRGKGLRHGSRDNADGKVSLKDIAGDIKDRLNEDKINEMRNGKKENETEMNEFGFQDTDERGDGDEGLMIASDEVTEITKGTVIDGNIVTDGSANIYGKIKGNLACRGRLFVSGTILGASRAADITMNNAKIDGDVTSDGNLRIGNGTVIIGNLYGTSAVIAGAVRGDIDIRGPVVIDSTAVIQGNVRSRSIQINNGAAIEGLISQSYAQIDFAALFDKTFGEPEENEEEEPEDLEEPVEESAQEEAVDSQEPGDVEVEPEVDPDVIGSFGKFGETMDSYGEDTDSFSTDSVVYGSETESVE